MGELCTISKGHGYSKADIRDAGTPLILYGRLYTQYESRIENVDTFAVEQEGSLLSKGNEVIVPASGETAEDIAVASSVRRSGIIFGGDLNVVTPVSKLDPDYIALAITYSKAHDDLAKRAQGKSVVHVHGNDIAEVEIPYPSESEQKRISTVVLGLDSLITLHQRKYDKLCTVKKSMLDKMFPKPGETEPEIRFEGFTDPWEQRKLGDCASFGGGHTPSMADSENYDGGNIPWVTSQDVKTHYLAETSTLITAKGARELTFYPVGSIAMVTRSGILRHTLPVAELHKPMVVNQDIRVIIPHKELSGQWLLQYLIGHERPLLLEYGKVGTTVESVDFSKMQGMTFPLPKMDEQCVIGAFFASIDNLITLHQRKLELLRNIKKSLLDRMFV